MKAKNILGKVLRLFTSDDISQKVEKKIQVDKNGILKDKHYQKKPNRAILASSKHIYNLVKKENINIEYGSLKENIIFNFNIHQLHIGDQVQIGEVILEISDNCTICGQLKKLGDKVPDILKNDRGIFLKAVSSGDINVDDLVYEVP